MPVAPLPKIVEPLKLVEQRLDLEGVIAISECNYLRAVLLEFSGDINVSLHFFKDEEGLGVIKGTVQAGVIMECQRCLKPVKVEVNGDINLALARNERAVKALPSYYDPLLLETPDIELLSLVEQELMLNLPVVATHCKDECSINSSYQEKEDAELSKPNPFAVLAQLKNQK